MIKSWLVLEELCVETSGSDYPLAHYHNAEEHKPQLHRWEALKSRSRQVCLSDALFYVFSNISNKKSEWRYLAGSIADGMAKAGTVGIRGVDTVIGMPVIRTVSFWPKGDTTKRPNVSEHCGWRRFVQYDARGDILVSLPDASLRAAYHFLIYFTYVMSDRICTVFERF